MASKWKEKIVEVEATKLESHAAMTFHTGRSGACECVGVESMLATMRWQHSHDFTGACFWSLCFLQQVFYGFDVAD